MKYDNLVKLYYKDKLQYEALYQKRYEGEETLHFDFQVSGNKAFFSMTTELVNLMMDILQENTALLSCVSKLPVAATIQFEHKCLVEEIKQTNEIEQIASTRKEIEVALSAIRQNGKSNLRLAGIVSKYLLLQEKPLQDISSCQRIREVYDQLVQEEIGNKDDLPDGELFRKEPVFVEKNGRQIHMGIMPETKIIEYLNEGIRIIHNGEIPGLVSTAIFHYLFGYVHPFYDGNGRMARYISSILLSKDLLFLAGYNLSTVIRKDLQKYYQSFEVTNDTKNKGDLTPFVTTFLEFVSDAVKDLSVSLNSSREKYQHFLPEVENNSILHQMLINTLFGNRGMSVEELAENLSLSVSTVRNNLKKTNGSMLRITRDGHKLLYDLDLEGLLWK